MGGWGSGNYRKHPRPRIRPSVKVRASVVAAVLFGMMHPMPGSGAKPVKAKVAVRTVRR